MLRPSEEEAMQLHHRRARRFWIGLVVALVGVGAVRTPPRPEAQPEIRRIVPVAPPVDLSPCALGSCW
jgi:hypothetical protein